MKVDRYLQFLTLGGGSDKRLYQHVEDDIKLAIQKVVWPVATNTFVINPQIRGNGVNPIKKEFIQHLKQRGWVTEGRWKLVDGLGAGPIDAMLQIQDGLIAVEWETGNISSSHRALNKMALGLIQKHIIGGYLIVPIRNLAQYLTDRIGNYEEIAPYFTLYHSLNISEGVLGIFGVDYDGISTSTPLIPKGKDGNAKKSTRVSDGDPPF